MLAERRRAERGRAEQWAASQHGSPSLPLSSSEQETRVAELMPEVAPRLGCVVRIAHEARARHSLDELQVCGVGVVPSGDDSVDGSHRPVGGDDEFGPSGMRRIVPSRSAADSSARTTVVPTATTLSPAWRVAFTSRAVAGETSNHSACGGSPASCEDSPAWRVIGATPIPVATRWVTSSEVNGLAALGISELPGRTAKTVW